MRVLAVDTAGSACSVALWQDGAVIGRRTEKMVRGQAERLMPMIRELAGEAGWRLSEPDLFAVTIGPGAFTGLRIGLAATAGMALAAGRPIVGISNLEAAAHAVPAERIAGQTLVAALDSRRSELFVQPFDDARRPLAAPACLEPDNLAGTLRSGPVLVTGDAAEVAAAALVRIRGRDRVAVFEAAGPADPAVVAALASGRAEQAVFDAPAPLYLRPPDATPAPAPRPIAP